jgi:hypothetical protein
VSHTGIAGVRPFVLTEGGPLFAVERRVGLIEKNAPTAKRRAVVASAMTWVPLLVLSALQGRAFGHAVPISFSRDISVHCRFLVAVPLLVVAESLLGPRLADAAAHFIHSGVVIEKDFERFDEFVERGLRARDSVMAEIVIAVLAYGLSILAFRETAVNVDSWYSARGASGSTLTWAGWWLRIFCAPLFQFLVFRWLWRLFLWFQFLGRVRELDLQLYPTHADGAAGLGFVGEAQRFYGVILFAISTACAGVIANDVLYGGSSLKSFAPAIATYVVAALLIILGPLVVFAGTLRKTKRVGLHEYGALSTAYSGAFHRRWIKHENPDGEELLGTGDIQSLADLGNSYSYVEKMKPLPVDLRTVLHLAVAGLLPMAPLLLTVMPLKDLLKLLFKVIA